MDVVVPAILSKSLQGEQHASVCSRCGYVVDLNVQVYVSAGCCSSVYYYPRDTVDTNYIIYNTRDFDITIPSLALQLTYGEATATLPSLPPMWIRHHSCLMLYLQLQTGLCQARLLWHRLTTLLKEFTVW